jgi:Tfp pilus assembly protein FimT
LTSCRLEVEGLPGARREEWSMSAEHAAAIACRLPAVEWPDRVGAWQAVTSSTLRTKTAVPRGVRLTFGPDHQAAHRLLDLVAAERHCCAWASWRLMTTADATVVEVTADGHGAETLQALFEVTP